jgi:hypothetical protein
MEKMEEVTLEIPLVLKELIKTSNDLLKQYQEKLLDNIHISNMQLMKLLGISEEDGWKLDIPNMMYVRHYVSTNTEPSTENIPS